MRFDIATPLLAALPLAAAHGAVTSYIIDGKTYEGYDGFAPMNTPETIQFPWPDYNPVMTATSPMMRCNGGTKAQLSAPVEAGKNITAVWKQWTHQQGPVMVWLYKCEGEFGTCTGEGKGWFKIDQVGLTGPALNSNDWGTNIVYSTKEFSSVVPKNIAPGNYLVRHELLALHQANTPQFYPECAQIVISGSGTAVPPANYTFTIPTYAPQSDPGIMVDIYMGKATTYSCPAGPVWEGFEK